MKRLLLLISCALIVLSSCRKEADRFVGDYSFKTSGEISITANVQDEGATLPIPASLDVDLSTEMGQLNICISDKKNDEVVVVINHLNGDVVVTNGTCNDKTIELEEFRRDILPLSVSSMFTEGYDIMVGGTGKIYDDMIIFDITCSGHATLESTTFKIKEKDIKMVAYRN